MAGMAEKVGSMWPVVVQLGLMWIFLTTAVAAGMVLFVRLKIMMSCGSGWADAGVLMRRRSQRALHARIGMEWPPEVEEYLPPDVAGVITTALAVPDHPVTETFETVAMPTYGPGAAREQTNT